MKATSATFVSWLAALCACALLMIGVAAPLATARTVTGNIDGLPISAIDGNRNSTVSFKLPAPNPFDDVPPGQLPPGPLAGTKFTVKWVADIDLTTQAGWDQAVALDPAEVAAKGTFDIERSAITGSDGTATISNLPVGVYLVTATRPEDSNHAYPEIEPFLLTLPVGSSSGWGYAPIIEAKASGGTPPTPNPTPVYPWDPDDPNNPEDPPGRNVPGVTPNPSTTQTPPPVRNNPTPPDGKNTDGSVSTSRLPGALASTGASVIGLALAAAGLFALGGFALWVSRTERKSDKSETGTS